MPIQQLPIELANQIAAGEVVERPSSVVKELIENALDAGANELVLDIEKGGSKRIRIRDNGCGISRDELTLALSRHATSKIKSLEDLECIGSLGFRGEALASISSVSRLRLTSKPAEQSEAWQAWTEGRDMQVNVEPAAHPNGTTVDIQDLFFNTPARRKFLRTEKTEFSHIDEVIKRIALSRFDVAFQLSHNGKTLRRYPRADSEKQQLQRVAKICGGQFAEQAYQLQSPEGDYKLKGWMVAPEHCRYQGDVQHFFVNGRMMRDKLLAHAVRQAYEKYLPTDRVPTYILYFELPAEQVDVNVHPAKHEVRFHYQRQVHDFILTQVERVLRSLTEMSVSAGTEDASVDFNGEPYENAHRHQYQSNDTSTMRESSRYSTAPRKAMGSLLPNAVKSSSGRSESQFASTFCASASVSTQETTSPSESWRLLSLFNGHQALVRHSNRLAWLNVRQVHAVCAQEKLSQQLEDGLSGQPLLVPVTVSAKEFKTPVSQWPEQQLNRLGVMYYRQKDMVVIEQMPEMLRKGNVALLFKQLLEQVSENSDSQLLTWLTAFVAKGEYSTTEAEHWVKQWRDQLHESADYLQFIEVPEADNANH
ncbi:DNA mismatch repair endonuclease MutL [Idiomarina piscisalsi]|uniref:DNA mismatch repair protein MutL n=1 Tax=Idiomarina piscisalsi TaxID=1096243 RepID=A0A432YHM8_9GAMM|nr:DNA mismatch repair endonuclease MutL [Idiomarina piscisalsi]RUO60415.1 DNA mismatch repair protein MutL [Idiomarina piscisalsi]